MKGGQLANLRCPGTRKRPKVGSPGSDTLEPCRNKSSSDRAASTPANTFRECLDKLAIPECYAGGRGFWLQEPMPSGAKESP